MIIGNLGRDPEMHYTKSGNPLTKFRVATNRNWTSPDGERHEETEWFNVIAWGKLAEICNQYLTKGAQVYIEGRLQTRQWEDSDGKQRSSVEINAQEMLMLGNRPPASEGSSEEDTDMEDEFPF